MAKEKNLESEALYLKESLSHLNKKIAFLVESERDKIFWKTLLEAFLPSLRGQIDFPFYSQSSGKGEALKYAKYVDKTLIVARDSDNEYLYKEDKTFDVPFIYHTYYYSIESHLCYAQNLNNIIYKATLCDYNLLPILEKYSEIVYPVLLHWLYFKHINKQISALSWKEYEKKDNEMRIVLSLEKEIESVGSIKELDFLLEKISERVELCISNLVENEDWYEAFQDGINEYESFLNDHHKIPKNDALFYLSGHIIFSYVIAPLMEKVVLLLRTDYMETQIKGNISQQKNQENKLKEYKNLNPDLPTLLLSSFEYCLINTSEFEAIEKIKNKVIEELGH
ncbi:MAG: DUF4435 domain-containing protein [Bacteroidia bacterium]